MSVKETKKTGKKGSKEKEKNVSKKSHEKETVEPAAPAPEKVVEQQEQQEQQPSQTQSEPEAPQESLSAPEETITPPAVEEPVETTPAVNLEELPKQEPVIQPAISIMSANICTFNRSINNYLVFALDTLDTCSVKEIDKIIRARITIYENFFAGVATAPTLEASNEFIGRFLDALHKRPNVTNPTRSLVGFMRLSTLTKPQANLYQIVWKILIDTCNPETRSAEAAKLRWGSVSPFMTFHKKGDVVNQRMLMFYQKQ